MKKTVVSVLRDARALVAKGWTRGTMHRRPGGRDCYCAVAALRMATYGDLDEPLDFSDLGSAAGDAFAAAAGCGSSLYGVLRWNDRQTTKKPVLAAFDKAIADAEAKS